MLKVIIFTNDRLPTPKFPVRDGIEFIHIEFYSSRLEDLSLIARHRVLKYPTSIVLDIKGKVMFRTQGVIDKQTISELLND